MFVSTHKRQGDWESGVMRELMWIVPEIVPKRRVETVVDYIAFESAVTEVESRNFKLKTYFRFRQL